MLYFTGSAYFNRSLRLYSRKLGYSLSDHGLVSVKRLKNEKLDSGVEIKCESEQDIFKALGIDYISPEDRDI